MGDTVKTPDGGRRRSMIVFLNPVHKNRVKNLKFWCKKNGIAWKYQDLECFVVAGLYDELLRLTDQLWVSDWHWVGGGKGLEAQGQSKKDGSHSQDKHR